MNKMQLIFVVLLMTTFMSFGFNEVVRMPEAKLCPSQTHYWTDCVASGDGCDMTKCLGGDNQ
jgi:hypothetical protein